MSNGSEVMIYLSFLLSEFIATRCARLEAREAGFLVTYKLEQLEFKLKKMGFRNMQEKGILEVHSKKIGEFLGTSSRKGLFVIPRGIKKENSPFPQTSRNRKSYI